jgi:hypothetical protein
MRAVFLVMTFVSVSTGEPVKEPAEWRFRGVTIDECRALLEAEKEYDASFELDDDVDSVLAVRKILVHRMRDWALLIEDEWAKAGKPIEVTMACVEREVEPDPWEKKP